MSMGILVVDDDEVVGRVLGRTLARQGYTIWRASSVGQAQWLAREHHPRLALIDLCLPDGDGIELARQLRAEFPELTMVLITAYPLRLRDNPDLAADFTRVLTKPFGPAELRQVVEEALALCG
jgi:CheY-like chemotaxis protein